MRKSSSFVHKSEEESPLSPLSENDSKKCIHFFSFFFGGEIKKAYICISKPCCSEIGKLNTKKITGYIGISMAGCAFGYVFATRQITKDTDTPNPVYRSFLNKRQHGLSFFNPLSAAMAHIYYIRMR